MTNGGGAGVLAVDRLADFSGELAALSDETIAALDAVLPATWSRANPVDIIGDAGPERYKAAIEMVLADAGVDALLVMACPTALASAVASAEAVVATVKAYDARPSSKFKPILTSWLGEHDAAPARAKLRNAGIATYDTPADAIRSLSYLTGYSQAQRALMRTPPDAAERFLGRRSVGARHPCKNRRRGADDVDRAGSKGRSRRASASRWWRPTSLRESRTSKRLPACFCPDPRRSPSSSSPATSRTNRTSAAWSSDCGLPPLPPRRRRRSPSASAEKAPDARVDGFTVQSMVNRPGAHELIIGVSEDNLFGPTILFGAGGTAVEVIADTAIALPPLDLKLAHDLIGQTRIARLLAGYRDRAPADIDDVALALVRVSQMVIDCPEISAVDINPLLADGGGVVALDARVVIDPRRVGEKAPNERLAIRPYPSAWEKRVRTIGGHDLLLRPIRPGRCAPLSCLRREAREPGRSAAPAGAAKGVLPRFPLPPHPDRLRPRNGVRRDRS